jgi:hypothetical protein
MKQKKHQKHKQSYDDDEKEDSDYKPKSIDFNIILSNYADDESYDDGEQEKIEKTLNEDIECNSDDEKNFMRENYTKIGEIVPKLECKS